MSESVILPAEGEASADGIRTVALPAPLLIRLFKQLRIPISTGALKRACDKGQQDLPPLHPVERVGHILTALNYRNLQAALIPWAKLDRRVLPVLLFHREQWWLAERSESGGIQLDSGSGERLTDPADELLVEAQVLWLRSTRRAEEGESKAKRRVGGWVLKELLHHKRWIFEVALATVVVNILAVMTSLFAMQVYDRVVPSFSYATLWALATGMVLVMLIDWLLKYIRARMVDSVAKVVDLRTSQQLFEHILNLRQDSRPRSLGTLAAQASGLESVRTFFSSTLIFVLTDMPFALMFIILIGFIGGKIGWVYAAILPISLLLGWLAERRLGRLFREELQRSTERQGLLVEAIQGGETIQATGSGWRFAEQWYEITASIAHYSLRSKLITTTTTTTAATLGTLAYVLAIVVGVQEIEAGHLTIGGLIASTILGGRVLAPVAQSVQILAQWQQVREAMEMVNRLLQLEPLRDSETPLMVPDDRPKSLTFEKVRFAYPQVPLVRLNIPQLQLQAGDRILLLGAVGSGKSTLLKLAAGLYRPSEGQVRLGHAEMSQLDPQVVVNHVGYLSQDIRLFKGSLRTNLGLAGLASDSRLLEIAAQVGIDRIAADNPRSMEMEISEGGDGLSGGQRQLLGLGRLMVAQPTLWLLDEPTASLDSESEQRVLEALLQAVQPEDILVIATHRTSLLPIANRVLVMRGGEIVLDDKPEALRSGNAAVKVGGRTA